ncbi:hypothetical protein E2986_05270 [Frieseomelitta varia]|uniref:CSN8/PSMD8/EIF3K domain-containing protein n=1 Tax=Frieseomelitta varia TaxID=561572 RepID=A0A833W2S0_9HYME|nr:hypothetical protein E2986_05270 [Frieseomelitta varia]
MLLVNPGLPTWGSSAVQLFYDLMFCQIYPRKGFELVTNTLLLTRLLTINNTSTTQIHSLCNAKYLWKRIPADLKSGNAELGQIWMVGQRMWQRDWPAVHVALNAEWSEDVSDIMAALKDNVRERAIILISKAYSSLGLTVFASMTGLTLEEARRVAVERGWTVDGTMVQPCKIQKEESNLANEVCLTEDQLFKLTQFVSFLEN